MPGLTCEAAGGHTEGSMNVTVQTGRRRRHYLRRRDLRLQRSDHRAFPRDQRMEPRVTGNHGTTKRQEKAAIKKVLAQLAVRAADPRPSRADRGRPSGRPPARFGARPDRAVAAEAQLVPGLSEGAPMSHTALRREFSDLIDLDALGRPAGRRFHLHRRADLAPARPISPVLRHAGRRAPPLGRKQRRARGHAAVEQMQRHDL